MIGYNNEAPKAVNNVGQFGATEGTIGAYKSAAEYAADAKYWALLSQTKYSSVEEILAEVERLYAQGRLLEEDIKQLKSDFESQEQVLLGLIQSTGTAIDNANAATELSKEATQNVLAQLDIISNMTVQTTLLPPGSLATGSYDNLTGEFSFGIPEGKPGRDGTDGTISDIGSVPVGTPVADDYGFYVDKDNGGLYRADMSDIANLVPSVRSVSVNGGPAQTGEVSLQTVSSFNSRTGAVLPQAGDYTVEQITGAAKSGDNSDITSLSGLSTAISVSQGGTGATTAAGARTNLGLGSVAVESVVPLTKGGTGATTAVDARTNLGLGLVSTESIVPILKGGTGATSAENARLALVAAKSGENSDITSFTNSVTFTQPVVVADAVSGNQALSLSQISSSSGASLVGSVQPFSGAVSRSQQSKNSDIVNVADFGAVGDGVTDDAGAISSAIVYLKSIGGGELHFNSGTFLSSTVIDLTGVNISLKGSGQYSTKLKASFSGDTFINLYEASDSRISPVSISDMFIDGSNTVGRVLSIKYRHYTKFTNVIISGGLAHSVYSVDAWLNTYINCGFESSNAGVLLDGANHRTAFYSCSFQGNTVGNLQVRSNGTVPDGNTALYFANCDFEFSSGVGIDFQGSDMTLDCCYLGENLEGVCLLIYSGLVKINGGVLFFGHTTNTKLSRMEGGTLIIDGALVNGQTHSNTSMLTESVGGKMALRNCQFNFPLGGSTSLIGDALLSLNDKEVFAPRLGVDYSSYAIRGTITDTPSGNNRTITVESVQGPEPIIIGLRAPLISNRWRAGEPWIVVVTYSSNVAFNVRVAVTEAGSGTVIGTLPETGGAERTVVLCTTTATRNNEGFLEIYRDSVLAPGHTFTLGSISFGDSRALGTEFGGNGGNLYKF